MSHLERVVGVISEIGYLTELHEHYKTGSRLPKLPSPDALQKGLSLILSDTSLDSRLADAAARCSSALLHGQEPEFLPYLAHALVLTKQSQAGKSNEIAFQETVRYLLAKSGYTPVRTQSYRGGAFHFYTDNRGMNVAAISEKGCQLYSARLKSEFTLDALVEDFGNLKEGRNKEVVEAEDSFRRMFLEYGIVAFMGGSTITLGAIFETPVYQLLDSNPLFALGTAFFVGGPTGLYAAVYIGRKALKQISTRKLRQEQPKFPYSRLSEGVYALLDAFPQWEKNVVGH